MFERISYIFLIITLLIFGFLRIFNRGYYSTKYKRYIDFGENHWIVGIIFIFLALYFAYLFFKKRK